MKTMIAPFATQELSGIPYGSPLLFHALVQHDLFGADDAVPLHRVTCRSFRESIGLTNEELPDEKIQIAFNALRLFGYLSIVEPRKLHGIIGRVPVVAELPSDKLSVLSRIVGVSQSVPQSVPSSVPDCDMPLLLRLDRWAEWSLRFASCDFADEVKTRNNARLEADRMASAPVSATTLRTRRFRERQRNGGNARERGGNARERVPTPPTRARLRSQIQMQMQNADADSENKISRVRKRPELAQSIPTSSPNSLESHSVEPGADEIEKVHEPAGSHFEPDTTQHSDSTESTSETASLVAVLPVSPVTQSANEDHKSSEVRNEGELSLFPLEAVSSAVGKRVAKGGRVKKAQEPPWGAREFREHYTELFSRNRNGAKPEFAAKENALIAQMMRMPGGLDEAIARCDRMFEMIGKWPVGDHPDLLTLRGHWDKFAPPAEHEETKNAVEAFSALFQKRRGGPATWINGERMAIDKLVRAVGVDEILRRAEVMFASRGWPSFGSGDALLLAKHFDRFATVVEELTTRSQELRATGIFDGKPLEEDPIYQRMLNNVRAEREAMRSKAPPVIKATMTTENQKIVTRAADTSERLLTKGIVDT